MSSLSAEEKRERVRAFVPALIGYTEDVVYADLWNRPELAKRDRSLVTLAAIIACYRPEQLRTHLIRALENGVTPTEISELITHMAFYAGWPGAMSAAQQAYAVVIEEGHGARLQPDK